MCGSTKAPPVVKDDPVADAKKAEAKATSKSNADLAERRRRLARNSLLTMGAQGTSGRRNTADNLLASIDQGLAAPPRRVTGSPKKKDPSRMSYLEDAALGGAGDPRTGLKDLAGFLGF